MQKLKLSVIDNMITSKLTSAEVNFILVVSRYQDETGKVIGVYYKDICKELDISYQKFYDIKNSLVNKGIIRASKESYTDWDITICNNNFSNPESYKEGYINTNHKIFFDKNFFTLKAGEKLLAMQFLKISYAGRGEVMIGVDKFYKKYTKLLGVSKRVVQNYMTSLRTFFSVGVKDHIYWIRPLVKVYRDLGSKSEDERYRGHIGETLARREKLDHTMTTLQQTVDLIKQYRDNLKDKAIEYLDRAIKMSLEKANEHVRNKYKWNRTLQPKLVHKILRHDILQFL